MIIINLVTDITGDSKFISFVRFDTDNKRILGITTFFFIDERDNEESFLSGYKERLHSSKYIKSRFNQDGYDPESSIYFKISKEELEYIAQAVNSYDPLYPEGILGAFAPITKEELKERGVI